VIVGAVALGIVGTMIGSFLNVVVYRMPLGRSVVSPPSACPHCDTPLRALDNVPLVSWLALRGRCRTCASPISARYPLVELGTALLFALIAWAFLPPVLAGGGAPAVLELVAFLYLGAVSVALALIDADTMTLPNRIIVPSYAVGAVLLGLAGVLAQDWQALLGAGIGAIGLFGLYLGLALAKPGGMGFGDVKLAALLGLYLGFIGLPQLAVGVLAAFLLGGAVGVALVVSRRATRRTAIPFGPWMIAGAWVGILAGGPIVEGYLRLFGLY
jgi:leader peptidase (prepilin peptidase)/N-methyltransferase